MLSQKKGELIGSSIAQVLGQYLKHQTQERPVTHTSTAIQNQETQQTQPQMPVIGHPWLLELSHRRELRWPDMGPLWAGSKVSPAMGLLRALGFPKPQCVHEAHGSPQGTGVSMGFSDWMPGKDSCEVGDTEQAGRTGLSQQGGVRTVILSERGWGDVCALTPMQGLLSIPICCIGPVLPRF